MWLPEALVLPILQRAATFNCCPPCVKLVIFPRNKFLIGLDDFSASDYNSYAVAFSCICFLLILFTFHYCHYIHTVLVFLVFVLFVGY